jgi:hypothetical protein
MVGFAGSAQAALLGELDLDDCATCEGADLYIKVEDGATYGYTSGFVITYEITITADYYGTKDGMNQVGFKVIQDWDVTGDNDVLSSPTDPIDTWDPVFDDPINVGSPNQEVCQTNSSDTTGWVCLNGYVDITTPGTYAWVVYLEEGTLMDVEDWGLGGQYANSRWRSLGNIISETGAEPVPEPTAALLFGLGAILVTRSVRRR